MKPAHSFDFDDSIDFSRSWGFLRAIERVENFWRLVLKSGQNWDLEEKKNGQKFPRTGHFESDLPFRAESFRRAQHLFPSLPPSLPLFLLQLRLPPLRPFSELPLLSTPHRAPGSLQVMSRSTSSVAFRTRARRPLLPSSSSPFPRRNLSSPSSQDVNPASSPPSADSSEPNPSPQQGSKVRISYRDMLKKQLEFVLLLSLPPPTLMLSHGPSSFKARSETRNIWLLTHFSSAFFTFREEAFFSRQTTELAKSPPPPKPIPKPNPPSPPVSLPAFTRSVSKVSPYNSYGYLINHPSPSSPPSTSLGTRRTPPSSGQFFRPFTPVRGSRSGPELPDLAYDYEGGYRTDYGLRVKARLIQ